MWQKGRVPPRIQCGFIYLFILCDALPRSPFRNKILTCILFRFLGAQPKDSAQLLDLSRVCLASRKYHCLGMIQPLAYMVLLRKATSNGYFRWGCKGPAHQPQLWISLNGDILETGWGFLLSQHHSLNSPTTQSFFFP